MRLRERWPTVALILAAGALYLALTVSAETLERAVEVEQASADTRRFCTVPYIVAREINRRMERPTVIRTTGAP